MAVKIRLKKMGRKGVPFYRLVAVDSRGKRDGRVLEYLGTYDPLKQDDKVKLSMDRIDAWIKKGAVPSETVASFLKTRKV